jgi:hypothetical protein
MRVVVLYRDRTDYARTVIEFLHDFKAQTGHDLTFLDPDSAEGMLFCDTYGIFDFPTIIATTEDGVMQNIWNGLPLPTISELSYYVQ